MSTYRLKLRRFELVNVEYQYLGAFRLRVEASDADGTGTDPHVFLYQRNLPNPYDGTVQDIFLGIASTLDMSEYPIGEPDGQTDYPFFRLDFVELDVRSVFQADQSWTVIKRQVDVLLRMLATLKDKLTAVEEVFVGEGSIAGGIGNSSAGSL